MTQAALSHHDFSPRQNYEDSKEATGYLPRREAAQADYDRIGFQSGLEVHQQLKTGKKLFCNCPSGLYNSKNIYDAELIRHMRPTLSELGEYDGTALMEFKTRKEIVYRIKNETACTYDIDDTPPFPINREALDIALKIALICKLNIVGEVHITRKQYLDGSIPTGFQRTAILGVEGEIQLRNKRVRLIQLSIEEDSCREISDVGHVRVYQTDRLGIPLIETVTYPDFTSPDEVREGADYIRFLNRSTGEVLTGIGAGREDVNVSCRGGSRVEIKGVSHNRWIPELTHNEAFRQWALLRIVELLEERSGNPGQWGISSVNLEPHKYGLDDDLSVAAVNLPGFRGILSHFTQPGKLFADELSDRLKVIACIEKPNMAHSEELSPSMAPDRWHAVRDILKSDDGDAQVIIWGPEEDMPTALETVEERCRMAFEGVPRESRKSLPDGTTVFERVLPGPDRMYPDTDSAPIPLAEAHIEAIGNSLPVDVSDRFQQLEDWGIPSDTFAYILRNNLSPLLERTIKDLEVEPKFAGTLFGHAMRHIEGQYSGSSDFIYERIYELIRALKTEKIDLAIAPVMLRQVFRNPESTLEQQLDSIGFRRLSKEEILDTIPELIEDADESGIPADRDIRARWMMGELRKIALGNMPLRELREHVEGSFPEMAE